jgi:hypothetical protein
MCFYSFNVFDCVMYNFLCIYTQYVILGGLEVSVLATGLKVRRL